MKWQGVCLGILFEWSEHGNPVEEGHLTRDLKGEKEPTREIPAMMDMCQSVPVPWVGTFEERGEADKGGRGEVIDSSGSGNWLDFGSGRRTRLVAGCPAERKS